MKLLCILAASIAVAACSTNDADDELNSRAVVAVERYGNEDLTADETADAAAGLIDACKRSRESLAYKLGTIDSGTPEYLDALRYVCPEVFSD